MSGASYYMAQSPCLRSYLCLVEFLVFCAFQSSITAFKSTRRDPCPDPDYTCPHFPMLWLSYTFQYFPFKSFFSSGLFFFRVPYYSILKLKGRYCGLNSCLKKVSLCWTWCEVGFHKSWRIYLNEWLSAFEIARSFTNIHQTCIQQRQLCGSLQDVWLVESMSRLSRLVIADPWFSSVPLD